MAVDQASPAGTDASAHHAADDRNVAEEGTGLGGKDIFFAAVRMTRMPMCLSDPNQPGTPLVFVNEAFQRMTGYASGEVLGRNCRFLQGPDSDPAVVQQIRDALADQHDLSVELVNYRKDGTPFWNALYLSPVFDADGSLIYFFASQLDVTRRREAEAMLQRSRRMEALGSMASGVAHEFNNLMTVVVGSTQQALAHVTDARQRRQLERAEASARHAGRLTQQMLSFARRQFHDPQPADLNRLLAGMDDLLGHVVQPGVTLRLDLAARGMPVCVDAGQLEVAVMNLVRNASDAMPDGGTLTVSTLMELAGGGRIMPAVRVRDTGSGMTQDVMAKALEPFFTTKQRGKGAGLGLSMVAGFAEQSGGHVRIESAPGAGTLVALALPLHGGQPEEGSAPAEG